MEIVLSIIAVIFALSCLAMLLMSDTRAYIKQATVKRQALKVKNTKV
jgi:hypothetical protein